MTAAAGVDLGDLCFTARALAQSHPMSETAHRYRQACVERERQRQPVDEPADWAGTALLVGYCLRRAEEQQSADQLSPAAAAECGWDGPDHRAGSAAGGGIDEAEVAAVSEVLRTGDAGRVSLLPAGVTVGALDRIIATELDKRREHLREQLDDGAWAELEDYIAWWVIHGYALRASERSRR